MNVVGTHSRRLARLARRLLLRSLRLLYPCPGEGFGKSFHFLSAHFSPDVCSFSNGEPFQGLTPSTGQSTWGLEPSLAPAHGGLLREVLTYRWRLHFPAIDLRLRWNDRTPVLVGAMGRMGAVVGVWSSDGQVALTISRCEAMRTPHSKSKVARLDKEYILLKVSMLKISLKVPPSLPPLSCVLCARVRTHVHTNSTETAIVSYTQHFSSLFAAPSAFKCCPAPLYLTIAG